MRFVRFLSLVAMSSTTVALQAQDLPVRRPPPAIGQDYDDGATRDDRIAPPEDWPRADAAAAGMEDVILDERSAICADGGGADCNDVAPGARAFRGLARIAGGYVMVPFFHRHFGR